MTIRRHDWHVDEPVAIKICWRSRMNHPSIRLNFIRRSYLSLITNQINQNQPKETVC